MSDLCTHLSSIKEIKIAKELVCEECIKHSERWLHLRTCQTCGVTLCCDDSPHQHATKHYHSSNHPVIISSEPGERWMWCYKDEMIAEY